MSNKIFLDSIKMGLNTGAFGRRIDPMSTRPISYEVEELTPMTMPMDNFQNEYSLTAKISISFWANSAQLEHATKNAKLTLMHQLFSDPLNELMHLRQAVFDGNRELAFKHIDRMQNLMTEI